MSDTKLVSTLRFCLGMLTDAERQGRQEAKEAVKAVVKIISDYAIEADSNLTRALADLAAMTADRDRAIEDTNGAWAKVLAELAAMTATAEDYRIQACRPDDCKIKAERDALLKEKELWTAANSDMRRIAEERNRLEKERDALLAENQWHLASEFPRNSGNILLVDCGQVISGYFNGGMYYDDNSCFINATHWRELPQPPKGAT